MCFTIKVSKAYWRGLFLRSLQLERLLRVRGTTSFILSHELVTVQHDPFFLSQFVDKSHLKQELSLLARRWSEASSWLLLFLLQQHALFTFYDYYFLLVLSLLVVTNIIPRVSTELRVFFQLLLGNFLWFARMFVSFWPQSFSLCCEFSFQPFDFLSILMLQNQPDRKFPSAVMLWDVDTQDFFFVSIVKYTVKNQTFKLQVTEDHWSVISANSDRVTQKEQVWTFHNCL